MAFEILREIGLSENEIKIYLELLKKGSNSAYELGKLTGIYRPHVYDKLEQLMNKGLVTHIYKGAKKYFQATGPEKIKQILENRKNEIETQENALDKVLPELEAMSNLTREDTYVEVFKGKEGLKYFLKDIIKTGQDVLVSGIDDQKYQNALPIFMKQYFRDLKNNKIKEKVITMKKKQVFLFDKKTSPTTEYRFLEEKQFNPTNTFIYGDKIVIVVWGTPITATMIKNKNVAETYKNHFNQLWNIASEQN